MKRGHTRQDYLQKIQKLRAVRPNISLSSDFIVGFPGETQSDFDDTMALIEEVGFDVSFSFIYSARPGTPAATLTDDTPEGVKKEWLQRLQAKNSRASGEYCAKHGWHVAAPFGYGNG